jgi:hypothetical protein
VTHSFEPEMPLVLLEITRQVANAENFASHWRKIMFVKNSKLVSGNPGLLQKLDTDSYTKSLLRSFPNKSFTFLNLFWDFILPTWPY